MSICAFCLTKPDRPSCKSTRNSVTPDPTHLGEVLYDWESFFFLASGPSVSLLLKADREVPRY